MHFHLLKPLHNWREFVGEIGVIVIGVVEHALLLQSANRSALKGTPIEIDPRSLRRLTP